MDTYKKIIRLVGSVVFYLTSLALLVTLIYFFSDYEGNVELNMYIDDFTVVFIAVMMVVFLALGTLELFQFKKVNNKQKEMKK